MTDKQDRNDPLHKFIMQMLGLSDEDHKTRSRNAGNLSEQMIQLANEYLDAGKNSNPPHTRDDVLIALTRALASTIAQCSADSIPSLFKQYDAVCALLRSECVIAAMTLHCMEHHGKSKEK